jgi:3-deoxy-manno-octulosonate cytidylyltransferase (CMP-KDO synthetase)
MRILGIIPARYDSSRFPGKPLAVIHGKTMIRRVYEQASKCSKLDRVVVATDHETIFNHVNLFGGNVLMTGKHHKSGTERCGEVVEKLYLIQEEFEGVINIQGDEPFIEPDAIGQVANCLGDGQTQIATLVKKIGTIEELESGHVVKVVSDLDGNAMLFSRSPIPFIRGTDKPEWAAEYTFYKHIGIYGYRTDVLRQIVTLPPSRLEQAESLEQLRWMEHGYRIKTKITDFESIAIDTPEDLLKITNTL